MQVFTDIENADYLSGKTKGPDIACKVALREINGLETALGDVKNVSFCF